MSIFEKLVRQINKTNRQICKQLDDDIAWVESTKEIYAQVARNMNEIVERSTRSESDNK